MASDYPNGTAASSPTALLPKNAFGGKTPEVGKVCSFRVVRVYDDQVEVEYAHSEDEDYGGEELGSETAPPAEGEMTEYLS